MKFSIRRPNETKSGVSCDVGHIYLKIFNGKLFVQCLILHRVHRILLIVFESTVFEAIFFLDNIWIIKVEVNAEIAKCVDLLLFVSSLPRSAILISIKVNWIDGQEMFLTTIGLKVFSVSGRKKI